MMSLSEIKAANAPKRRRRVAQPPPAVTQGWTDASGHLHLGQVEGEPRVGQAALKPRASHDPIREALLDDIIQHCIYFAGLACVAAERPELRAHTARCTLVNLRDARDHQAAAIGSLNPEGLPAKHAKGRER